MPFCTRSFQYVCIWFFLSANGGLHPAAVLGAALVSNFHHAARRVFLAAHAHLAFLHAEHWISVEALLSATLADNVHNIVLSVFPAVNAYLASPHVECRTFA